VTEIHGMERELCQKILYVNSNGFGLGKMNRRRHG